MLKQKNNLLQDCLEFAFFFQCPTSVNPATKNDTQKTTDTCSCIATFIPKM